MNTTTELFIRPVKMHPDQQIKTDLTLIALLFVSALVITLVCSIGAQHDPHRDCALRITQGLSPFQGQTLIRAQPTYAQASRWCSLNVDSDTQIQRARRWPMFPPSH